MSAERTRAIVLRRTNYGEADRILTLITPHGQRSVIARGARREKSKLAGGIELFTVSDVVIQQGRGELGILSQVRPIVFYSHILEDYDRLQFAYEAIRAIIAASEHVDEPEWYGVLSEVYMGLDVLTIPLKLVESWFYFQYAELMGYAINLRADVQGRALEKDKKYTYDVAEKGLRTDDNGDISADAIKIMRLLSAKPIATIVQVGGVTDHLPVVWMVARQHAAL